MCRILLQSKKNLLHLTTMAEQSLQSMFHQVFVTQRFIQQLSSAEDMIIDVSDYLDEQEVPHEDTFFQIRAQIRQLQTNLQFHPRSTAFGCLQSHREFYPHLWQTSAA